MACSTHARRFAAAAGAILCGLLLAARGRAETPIGEDTVTIENAVVTPRDAATATIRFDLAWNDSWRDQTNHDAVWIFFKALPAAGGGWQPVRLAADKVLDPTGYTQEKDGTRLDFIVPDGPDGFVGMFVRRAEEGKGPVAAKGVTAILDLAASKALGKVTSETKVTPLAIEMVYVDEGPYALGSGGLELNGLYEYSDGVENVKPFRVTSAGAIPTGRQPGRLWAWKAAQPEDGGEIPATFPNGYAAFYAMKKRISSPQYTTFLNMLPPAEAEKRFFDRIAIRSGEPPNVTYEPWLRVKWSNQAFRQAGSGLSWGDGAAYAAWAGLRPISELEMEKAVRGPRAPRPDEVGPSHWKLDGFANGVAGDPRTHADWFAYKSTQAERAVTIANAKGRGFRGTHGLGTTDLPADWPQEDAVGAGFRCCFYGFWHRLDVPETKLEGEPNYDPQGEVGFRDLPRTRLSDRYYADHVDPERRPYHRWRAVRSAPAGVGK